MKTTSRLTTLLLIVLISLFSCRKDEDEMDKTPNPAPAEPSMSLEKEIYNQYELAKINVANINYQSEEYVIQIDTFTHQASVIDGDLYFLTPDFDGGNYSLSLNVEGINYTTNFTINELADIQSPESYVNNIKDSVFNFSIIDSIIAEMNRTNPSPTYLANRNLLQQFKNDFESAFNQLNLSEKKSFAKFVKTNEDIFRYTIKPIKSDSLNYTKTAGDQEKNIKDYKDGFNRHIALTFTALAGFTATYKICRGSIFALNVCGGASALFGGSFVALLYTSTDMANTLLDKTFIFADAELAELNSKSFQLEHNKPYEAKILTQRRSMYEEDDFSTHQLVGDLMFVFDEAKAIWDKAKNLINDFAQLLSKNYTLVGEYPHPADFETYKSQWFEETATFYSVANVSNDLVELKSQQKVNDKLVLKFANEDTTDQQFSFELIYDDGSERAVNRLNATIEGRPDTLSILGTWNLVERRLNGQTYTLGQWYMYPGYVSTPNCSNIEVFDFRLKDLSSTFIIRDSTIDFSESNVEQSRTFDIDSLNCRISSYGTWDNTQYPSGTDYYEYEIISDTQMRIREVGTSQYYVSDYSYDGVQFILTYDTDEYLIYER